MLRLIASRLGQSAVVLLAMSFVVYALIGLMPGDPVEAMIAAIPNITPEDAMRMRARFGLDQPLLPRYLNWLAAALTGDLGYSRLFAARVVDLIGAPLANTALLMLVSLALALAVALPLGVAAGRRPGGWVDRMANGLAFASISLPTFWLGMMLITLLAVRLGWLPAGGVMTVGNGSLADRALHLLLPAITLAVPSIGGYVRYMRASMADSLAQDWVRTARAKGASEGRIVRVHALRMAMIPVVTILALDIGTLFSGALVTETVFAYPGMGKLIAESVLGNDYNLALAGLMLATGLTLAGNLLADLAYGWLDPRIRHR